jgi:hypothetical protein
MLTLLSMSALTIVLLVLIVTTVADMDLRPAESYLNGDPWVDVQFGSVGGFTRDRSAYVDATLAPAPGEDRVARRDAPAGDPF